MKQQQTKSQEKLLTALEFAQRVGWSHDTVLRMVRMGRITGKKKNPLALTSPVLIPESELKKVLHDVKA